MLYYLKKKELRGLAPITLDDAGWTEKDLEDLLADNVERLVRTDQLMIIAQQRRMQEEADIMALDQSGTLFLFELKRWKSQAENLLQVLRYGQRFGRYEYARLNHYFRSYRDTQSADAISLKEAHAKYFSLDHPLPEDQFNRQQRFIIVTNGLDQETWEAIGYWKSYKLPVEAVVYRVYREEASGTVFLDFDPYGPEVMAPQVAEEGLFVVNTNVTYAPDAFRRMLRENTAIAYGDRRFGITRVKRGAPICLYHVGVGVIAIGTAVGNHREASADREEYYVPCKFDYKVDPEKEPGKAVQAWEINSEFGTSHRFRQTVFALPREFERFIRRSFQEKGAKRVS